jgi:hypothetical protein
MLTADIVFVAALIVMAGCNLYFAPRIKGDRIAMQSSFGGNPSWYAPKLAGMWGPLGFAVLIRSVIWAAQTYTPDKVHGAEIGLALYSVIILAVHITTLKIAAR